MDVRINLLMFIEPKEDEKDSDAAYRCLDVVRSVLTDTAAANKMSHLYGIVFTEAEMVEP